MIVIDTSALCKFLLKEEGWMEVVPYLQPESNAHAVEMLLTETTNVIWKNVRIYRNLRREDGEKLLSALELLVDKGVITIKENRKYLRRAFELSVEHNIAIYDALFIAQAQKLNATLVTCDEKQGKVAEKLGISVVLL
ncbi:type II toxin-antitoxin system VapC family toxin [Thermococcus atlanticus]